MNKKHAKKRIEDLKIAINKHRNLYHLEDKEEISEGALDSLKHELKKLEDEHTELITADSPTQFVAGGVKKGFKKVTHKVKQWSFNDVFDEEEITDWVSRLEKLLKTKSGGKNDYCCELKIDGVKVILEYKKGILVNAASRGDGEVGEDITENVRTIESIPIILDEPIDVIVEGEAWIGKTNFDKINKKLIGEKYANPRNLTAGSLRHLDSNITKSRMLDCFVYEIAQFDKMPKTQGEKMELIKKLKFPHTNHKIVSGVYEIIKYWKESYKNREKNKFITDGVVVKLNSVKDQKKLGYTGKAPRFAIALKFPSEQKTSILKDITFQVGRTGVITPIAEFETVFIDGSNVRRATLHNEDRIKELDVRIGDTLVIQKAGDIIPEVISIVHELRDEKSKKFKWPKKIDDCGGDGSIERVKGESAWRCVSKDSYTQNIKKLSYFASKGAFDIVGLGEKNMEKFYEAGLIKSYKDIFNLKKEDIEKLEGFKEKAAHNIIEAIKEKREIELDRFLVSLSIDGLGEETAILLANYYKTIDKIENVSCESLTSISGLGEKNSQRILDWFKEHKDVLNGILECVNINKVKIQKNDSFFNNKSVVITGTFTEYSREEIKNIVRVGGGVVKSAITKNTNFLIAGEKAGSKLTNAKTFGVKIINEKELLNIIQK